MDGARKMRTVCWSILWVSVCAFPAFAGEAAEAGAVESAARFARLFVDGTHEQALELMSPEMRTAQPPEKAEPLRAMLVSRNGEVKDIGKAWMEDTVQGYRRVRVPVVFEKATLDFRVVLDGNDKIAGFFIVPHAEPPAPADASPGREIDVRVGVGETAIPGTLTLPRKSGPFPGVVLVHGSGPNDRDETIGPNKPFRDLAWGLAERGVATLRYDKRSRARPTDLEALGEKLTVQHEVIDDARAALALLRAREEIDSGAVYLLGHSLGGMLAPRIAAAEPRPAGIIVMAGSTLPAPETVLRQIRYILTLDGDTSAEDEARIAQTEAEVTAIRRAIDGEDESTGASLLGVPVGYWRDLEQHDPAVGAASLGLPALILQGKRDYQVTMDDFARWQDSLGEKPFACLIAYEGLNHLFHEGSGPSGPQDYDRSAIVAPRVIDDIAGWVRERRCAE